MRAAEVRACTKCGSLDVRLNKSQCRLYIITSHIARGSVMIELIDVYKSYAGGKVEAVAGLNLKVEKGELFGFLGPNGAGKTTTIKMLVGLLKPDGGTITIAGIDRMADPLGVKRVIGYVPDESVAYEKMTGASRDGSCRETL